VGLSLKVAALLSLVWRLAVAQETARPITVVVIPAAIRDSMSVLWSQSNRDWNDSSQVGTRSPQVVAVRPTRAHLGCLAGEVAGDTVLVRQLMPAANVRKRESSVTGDCSTVSGVIGTWHTHPYRAGYEGRAIKERALSGKDLKTFIAANDLVTIVMWDADSLDLATKGPDGLRHPATAVIR